LVREVASALEARPRHRVTGSRLPAIVASLLLVVPLAGVIFALNVGAQPSPRHTRGARIPTPGAALEQEFGNSQKLDLPAAAAPPAPSPPVLASIPNLPAHEVFGFAPYWTLAQSPGFAVGDLSTIAYFSLDVNPDGSIDESGPGWVGYESEDLVDLINRAHAADDRVVLTVTCFDQSALDQLTSDPSAPGRLASSLVSLMSAKSFDGVNIDFEGNGPGDRAGLDTLVSQVSSQLRAADPHWQITMDTYASSAGDPSGFFDIPGLAPSVDGFFVMAYDMDDPSSPSPTAPLVGGGNTDTSALEQYEAVVPASKVVLGVPAYGYDWPTAGPALGAAATGPPTAVSYAQVASMNTPVYWEPATQTPWTSYQVGAQWHQVFFDNPTSIALKARLAELMHIAGVGVWALGMDGNDPAMAQALLGSAQAAKYAVGPAPAATTPSTTTATAPAPSTSDAPASTTTTSSPYHYSGTYEARTVTLEVVNPSSLPGGGKGTSAGQLTGFSTNDPSAGCLSLGPPLAVTELSADASDYVVSAAKPNDCTNGTWMFSAQPSAPAGSTTTTTSPLQTVINGL
jgi:hypothetical protein